MKVYDFCIIDMFNHVFVGPGSTSELVGSPGLARSLCSHPAATVSPGCRYLGFFTPASRCLPTVAIDVVLSQEKPSSPTASKPPSTEARSMAM